MIDPATNLLEVGRVIAGRYRVEEVLGRGGMGAVYRVQDAKTAVAVALKRGFARDARKLEARSALLEREYHTLAQLAHPRIIEVYDYGVDERGPYYTMELLDGSDLGARQRTPWPEACALLRDVASSLAILHSRGLVHRDVSARNVRCTADGRAKLLDFGAMVSIGVAKELVGTPPFIAPESLQLQTLDARADLFSLGALAYFLLTGRHAYPARRIPELRDVWRSAPPSPSRLLPEIPAALSALVLRLLALDRSARPASAAEVMTRLTAIAGLPAEEHAVLSRAYLTTPVLVGRDRALLAVRRRMLSLARRDGGVLLVEGVAGSGRSRLLDACALEGKLLGAMVVRADASDSEREAWGVARALGTQLFELLPKEANEAARLSRDVLGHVLDGLRGESSAVVPERSLLLRELRDLVLSLARVHPLLLAIDDADRIDEPSLALLGALALKTERHPLVIALSVEHDGERSAPPSMSLLRSLCEPIVLSPLAPEETESLMRSVFGDVPNLSLCAGRIHALAQGNPRATMELAQHLIDRGLARYDAGGFSLPAELDEADPLPTSFSASLQSRLSRLSADALELSQALALADGDAVGLGSYAELTSHGEPRRVFAALDELVAARLLAVDADCYRFTQRGFVPVLRESTDRAQTAALHGRVAELLARTGGDVIRRAEHLMEAGRDLEAIDLLSSINLLERLPPLELLERAIERAEHHALPARTVHQLRMALLSKAPFVLAWESFARNVPPVLSRLERESGLSRYHELSNLPESERLSQALLQTQQRFTQTPEHDRVYPVGDAIRELARLSGAFCSMGGAMFARDVVESLPSLEPLRSLSPAIELVSRLVEAAKLWLSGRGEQSREVYAQVLVRIAEPDRAGLDDAQHARTRLGVHYTLGLLEALLGMDSAERHAQVLESDRDLRVNAWRLRQLMKLAQGDLDEARDCARRAELLQLQEGIEQRYLNTSASIELAVSYAAGDLLGVKNALKKLETLAEHFPGWRPAPVFGQTRYRQMQGDLQGALDHLLAGMHLAKPGEHVYFPQFATLHVELLCELGRVDEAVGHADRYVEICRREGLRGPDQPLYEAAALAWARAGQHERAVALMDEVIEGAVRLGRAGLALGSLYQSRARISMWMDDRAGFERFAALCGAEFKKGKSAALSAKFARLLDEARKNEIADLALDPQMLELISVTGVESEYETVESRMRECVDRNDRARCALTMLLQRLDGFAGYLFGANEDGQTLLAGLPDRAPEEGLRQWIDTVVRCELTAVNDVTATVTGEEGGSELGASVTDQVAGYTDAEGRSYESLSLFAQDGCGRGRLVAVLAYHVTPGPRTLLDRRVIWQIAAQLLDQGDVSGVPAGG